MFKSFNCGVGIDVVGKDCTDLHEVMREVCDEARINVFELGKCKKQPGKGNNVILTTDFGTFDDYK